MISGRTGEPLPGIWCGRVATSKLSLRWDCENVFFSCQHLEMPSLGFTFRTGEQQYVSLGENPVYRYGHMECLIWKLAREDFTRRASGWAEKNNNRARRAPEIIHLSIYLSIDRSIYVQAPNPSQQTVTSAAPTGSIAWYYECTKRHVYVARKLKITQSTPPVGPKT